MKKYLHFTLILIAAGLIMPEAMQAQKTGTSVTVVEKKGSEVTAREKSEQHKLTEEQKKVYDQQRKQFVEHLRIQMDTLRGRQVIRHIPAGDLDLGYVFYSGPSQGSQSRGMPRTSWDFSRSVMENSSSKEYAFEVEKDMKNLSLSISGMSKTGEIRIIVIMPGNKTYSEVVIDEYGSLNWKKSFELNAEAKDKFGVWKFKVTTSKASGNFRISLSAS